ncbi:uncharacterized protein LOC134690066 [Mytilus trossulus]|uniref:uncharacterized protein LOC134690066 n=1 Tax=Mytilus trossulus TaxID=6551 RepID=UPI003004F9A9
MYIKKTVIGQDENGEWNVLKCTEGETSEERLLVKSSSFECSDLVSLYCRNGSSAQKSITTMKSQKSNFTTPMKPDQITPPIGSSPQRTLTTVKTLESNFTTPMKPDQITPPIGVIVGIVSSIIVIGVVIFVVIVCRRRRSAKRKLVLKEDAHGQNDTEKTEHLENKNNYAYSEIEMEATNKKDHMDNGDNEYTTGPSDVYDHLNEKRNRKVQTENPHAIYDHAIGDNAEPDYDSTKHVVPTNPDYQEVTIRSEDESYREKL